MFGRRDRIPERRVHNHDTAAGGGIDIDIVDTDTGTADNFEIAGGFENLGRHLGRRPDREAVIFPDAGDQFFWLHAGNDIGFDAVGFEYIDGGSAQAV